MSTSEREARPAERATATADPQPGSELSSQPAPGGDAREAAPLTGRVAPPDDARQLELEIERTREQLGQTVQELVAKVDVRSRARATATRASDQVRGRVAAKGAPAWDAMPEPVRRTVTKGATGAREHRMVLAAAAGVIIIGCVAIRLWKARSA